MGILTEPSKRKNDPRERTIRGSLCSVDMIFTFQVFGSRVRVDAVSKVAELELAEKEKMKDKVAKILKHGCSVFINRQLIYNYPEQLFADAGVMAIEHADFEGVERLALVTGECLFLSGHYLQSGLPRTGKNIFFRSGNFAN